VNALTAFIVVALGVIALTACLNALTFPRLRRRTPTSAPLLSVLIPARDEAAVIGQTVRALLDQRGVDFELIVLDDASADGTAAAAEKAAAGDDRLRIVRGEGLPSGWLGKNWACAQLAACARGEWLLFADADVRWQPGALSALAAHMAATRADLLTVWPTQITVTWAERLVVPLMALAIHGYLPLLAVHHLPLNAFAAACGQCMLFRRAAYERIGGHAAVRGQIVEDVALARRVKRVGLRLRMADGATLIACRMYTNWPSVRDGFGKNILAGHGDSLLLLALSTVFHWLLFVVPALWLVGGLLRGRFLIDAALLVALGVGVRALTAAATRQRVGDALLMPLSALLMTIIAARAAYWRLRFGGPRWKGRVAKTA
jgi:chlorobactene glucosyltransferase